MKIEDIRINVAEVRADAYGRWKKSQRWKFSILRLVERTVPYWLVIVAVGILVQSLPHTAETFDRLTPGAGWAAPLFVEFGLLYSAYQREDRGRRGQKRSKTEWGAELLFLTASFLVNLFGAFTAVTAGGVANASFTAIWDKFGTYPASLQVALIMVPIDAGIIAVGTLLAGQGLALLTFTRRERIDHLAVQWQVEGPQVLYTAFYDAIYPVAGDAKVAKAMAANLRNAEFAKYGKIPAKNGENTVNDGEKKPLPKGGAQAILDGLFASDSGLLALSPKEIMIRAQAAGTPVGQTAVYEWVKAKKKELSWSSVEGPGK